MFVRKERAGASSTGHTWEHDGAVVEVPDHIGGALVDHSSEFADVTEEHLASLAQAAAAAQQAAQEDGDQPTNPAGDTPPDEGGEDAADGETEPDAETGDAADKPKRKYTRRTPIAE